jgi:hypothetical protein
LLGFLFNLVPVVLRVGAATVAMADFMGLRARAPTGLRLRGVRDGDGWCPGYCWLRNVVHSAGARDKAENEYQAASSHGHFAESLVTPMMRRDGRSRYNSSSFASRSLVSRGAASRSAAGWR